jgi:hypothetical protein
MHMHFYEIFLQRVVLLMTKCLMTTYLLKTHLLENRNASPETSSSYCMVRVAQYNIKLTSPLVERAISQDDEQSQVRGTPPKVIGRKRVQETNQCTAAHLMGPRASAAATVPPPLLHGVNRVGFGAEKCAPCLQCIEMNA